MPEHVLTTLEGGRIALRPEEVALLADAMDGELLTPLSSNYDKCRTIWNAMIDRRPGLIACCASTDDVIRSVTFARDHDLLVSVRGGGHNIGGLAVCDGGLTIDLSAMSSVNTDVASKTVTVGPGATLGDVDADTQRHGLAVPVGINSTTGIAGLTLGGGFGWLTRKYGMTIDNLVEAEVVTAGGDLLTANSDQNPDLFWGLRGGGGNFGVVTSFKFALHEVGPEVLSGLIVHPGSNAQAVLTRYREIAAAAPDELTVWAVLRTAPPLPFLPEEVHGTPVLVLALCYAGPMDEGQAAVAPFREIGTPIADVVGPHSFVAWQQAFDPLLEPGARNYWKTHNYSALSDGLLSEILTHVAGIPTPHSEVFIAQLGGVASRVSGDATAYRHRDAAFLMNVHTRWEDPADDDRCLAWARALFDATAPFATGGEYVNFMSADDPNRLAAAYGDHYDRLATVKRAYDAHNLFRCNHNVVPAG